MKQPSISVALRRSLGAALLSIGLCASTPSAADWVGMSSGAIKANASGALSFTPWEPAGNDLGSLVLGALASSIGVWSDLQTNLNLGALGSLGAWLPNHSLKYILLLQITPDDPAPAQETTEPAAQLAEASDPTAGLKLPEDGSLPGQGIGSFGSGVSAALGGPAIVAAANPEPSTWGLMIAAFAALGLSRRRMRRTTF